MFIYCIYILLLKYSILCAEPGHWCPVALQLGSDSCPRKEDTRLYLLMFKQYLYFHLSQDCL